MAISSPFHDPDYLKIGALFQELGLLVGTAKRERAPKQVAIETVLRIGENIEPRFLAVLPAAILSAPERFRGLKKLPPTLTEILEDLRSGSTEGPDLGPIPYAELFRWAERSPKDRRRKSVVLKKRIKSFRLSPRSLLKLRELSSERGITETEVIEELLQGSSSKQA